MTDAGIAEYWQVSCIPLTIYTYGFSDMTRDEVAKSIGAAAHTWSPSAVTCPDGTSHPFLEIVTSVADAGAKPPLPAYDGHNTVLFYSDAFPPPPESPFALTSGIVALTSVFARADGHIVDADVQVNAIPPMRWANRDPGYVAGNGQSDDAYDLQNATTHELGHLQGLGHTCWNAFSDLEQPINDMGMGVPMCDTTTDPSIADTVMFATISSPTELTKRTLSADDIRAVCEIYPSTSDPGSCGAETPNDGCGCSASGPPGPVLVLVLALVAVVVLARVRARR
jgi:MYXO-CTERM domain-containing protein